MIEPFPKYAPIQSYSESPKHLTSRLPSGREIRLARLVVENQVKWCDCPKQDLLPYTTTTHPSTIKALQTTKITKSGLLPLTICI